MTVPFLMLLSVVRFGHSRAAPFGALKIMIESMQYTDVAKILTKFQSWFYNATKLHLPLPLDFQSLLKICRIFEIASTLVEGVVSK